MRIPTALLALLSVLTSPLGANGEEAGRVCSTTTSLCYNEFVSYKNVAYRIAIPSDATAAPYDVAIQIVAPRATAWASMSWGGQMINAPLTLAWPNGNNVVYSTRYTNQHKLPALYTGTVSYTLLKDNGVNSTHWTFSAVCRGCTQWSTNSGATFKSINPAGTSVSLAFASNGVAGSVTQPSNPSSSFAVHDGYGYFTLNFNTAKATNFGSATGTSPT